MIKDIFITGYTNFITDEFLANAFPNCRIVITGETQVKNSAKNRVLVYRGEFSEKMYRKIFLMYEFDRVIYFSGSVAPFSILGGGELEHLSLVLDLCREEAKVVYLTGPRYPISSPLSSLQEAALEMCRRSQDRTAGVNVIISPWIYDLYAEQPSLFELFVPGKHHLPYSPKQTVSFIAAEDVAMLLSRMFNDWEAVSEPYYIPNIFVSTLETLTDQILAHSEGDEIEFIYTKDEEFPQGNHKSKELRSRFIWFPVYSFFEDLPAMISRYRENHRQDVFPLLDLLKTSKAVVLGAELLVGALITELLLRLSGIAVQFEMVDFRLLYVVIMGIMYDMRIGMIAAALESVSLIIAHFTTGTDWITLFYEPTNWLPFIAYFTVGALCGYIRAKDREKLDFANDEIRSVTERYNYITSINEDILQEKREYKQQIIGSRDSFGKIFDITRQLDSTHPKYIMGQAIEIIERVMTNNQVAIYFCRGESAFGRLSMASRDCALPFSMPMQQYYSRLQDTADGEAWVNRELEENIPMYMYAIRKNGLIEMVILLDSADNSQMTLYYENLFRVLCGLISNSLIKAMAYQEAIHQTQCVKGTVNVLSDEYFLEEMNYAMDSYAKNVATHLLLNVVYHDMSIAQVEQQLTKCIRTTDIIGVIDGKVYLILPQAHSTDMKFIGKRFHDAGLDYELLTIDNQMEIINRKAS